jgi:hypothetical protein
LIALGQSEQQLNRAFEAGERELKGRESRRLRKRCRPDRLRRPGLQSFLLRGQLHPDGSATGDKRPLAGSRDGVDTLHELGEVVERQRLRPI